MIGKLVKDITYENLQCVFTKLFFRYFSGLDRKCHRLDLFSKGSVKFSE